MPEAVVAPLCSLKVRSSEDYSLTLSLFSPVMKCLFASGILYESLFPHSPHNKSAETLSPLKKKYYFHWPTKNIYSMRYI